MIRRKGPILAVAVLAAFALGWYRGLFGIENGAPVAAPEAPKQAAVETAAPKPSPDPASAAPAQPAQSPVPAPEAAPSPPAPAAGKPQTQASAEPSAAPAKPGFDVVRVEPDGSAVVAGRGAANETISLTDGTRTFAETRTDANGDFVMSLSLPTGSHRLQLAQRDEAVSGDAAVVNVPTRGQPDQLLVMMERPGEASEVLQRPAETQDAAPALAEAAPAPAAPPEEQVAAVTPTEPEPVLPEAAPVDTAVSVEAVEIEGNRLFVAGSAKGKPTVRIYLDDAFVAESRSGDGDRFIASATLDVPVGDHTIRADAVDASGRVVGRVEVPFQRPEGTSMAAVAPAPDASPVTASSQTPPEAAAPAEQASPTVAETVAPAPAPTASELAPASERAPEVAAAPMEAVVPPTQSGEPQTVKQAPLQAAASRVIIRRGDTLWRISRETYGRGSRYTVIYLANGDQIRNPDRIYPGQVFRMPSAAEAETAPRG
ncbi:LysM peptidoglycan-binding domain-containing protein [Aureimonas sp. SK2]|uniref:LysM peptidoglycan-binding domain-containing protein n=1 Tax=Aureimonas sp. SK2 TaxID=3015992 RepID=UPI0024449B17|nr:LysM peptidoglycan-binding domain-containing protein [Aureimonas sp. SK2]